jgi:hypothetical protein
MNRDQKEALTENGLGQMSEKLSGGSLWAYQVERAMVVLLVAEWVPLIFTLELI